MHIGDGVIARRELDPRKFGQSGPIVPQGMFGKVVYTGGGKFTVEFDNGARIGDLTGNDVE